MRVRKHRGDRCPHPTVLSVWCLTFSPSRSIMQQVPHQAQGLKAEGQGDWPYRVQGTQVRGSNSPGQCPDMVPRGGARKPKRSGFRRQSWDQRPHGCPEGEVTEKAGLFLVGDGWRGQRRAGGDTGGQATEALKQSR